MRSQLRQCERCGHSVPIDHECNCPDPPFTNRLGHTEDEIADREEARRAEENENRHAVVFLPDPGVDAEHAPK